MKSTRILKSEYPPLKEVEGSSCCDYSEIERKLRTLYENQQIIYDLLVDIATDLNVERLQR